jgi:PTH1 family peptidyl-tRNA hydrolase
MITVVGLGNPGEEYTYTRHNIGWMVLLRITELHMFPSCIESRKYEGLIAEGMIKDTSVRALFPTTFMNNSGVSVARSLEGEDVGKNLIVIHDEIDVPFGDVRVSWGKGDSGHNGVRSIISKLETKEFLRVRIGIGKKNIFGMLKRPQGEALSKFVLGTLTQKELKEIEEITKTVDTILLTFFKEGKDRALQMGK